MLNKILQDTVHHYLIFHQKKKSVDFNIQEIQHMVSEIKLRKDLSFHLNQPKLTTKAGTKNKRDWFQKSKYTFTTYEICPVSKSHDKLSWFNPSQQHPPLPNWWEGGEKSEG